ncbi:MAG: ATP-binding cassette domain-containing protein [Deinococcales bacterium]
MTEPQPRVVVEMHGIEKRFGAVRALQDVDLILHDREILAVVGDNAAGKSTLMKVLSGAYHPDGGRIVFEGRDVAFHGPADARAMGIEMVYQDLALCDNMDVAQNIWLGTWPRRGLFIDRPRMDREARSVLDRLRLTQLPVRVSVATLSGGQRQSVALARALARDPKVLILDEPTASLSAAASTEVLDLIRQLRDHGVACLYITHRLQEIFEISDRIMVLKRGRNAGVRTSSETDEEEVLGLIIGSGGVVA